MRVIGCKPGVLKPDVRLWDFADIIGQIHHLSSIDHPLDAALAKMDENPDRIQIYKDTIHS